MKKLLFFFLMFLSAGAFSQTITNTVTLDGSGSSDPDGTISAYSWKQISGPSGQTMSNANTVKCTIVYTTPGIYLYELSVTDNLGAIGKDTVQVTVNAANKAPHAIISGGSVTIQLPGTQTSYVEEKKDNDIVYYSSGSVPKKV